MALAMQDKSAGEEEIKMGEERIWEGEKKISDAKKDKELGQLNVEHGRMAHALAVRNEQAVLDSLDDDLKGIVDGSKIPFRLPNAQEAKEHPQPFTLIALEPGEDPHLKTVVAFQDAKTREVDIVPNTIISRAFESDPGLKINLISPEGPAQYGVSIHRVFSLDQFQNIQRAYYIHFVGLKAIETMRAAEEQRKADARAHENASHAKGEQRISQIHSFRLAEMNYAKRQQWKNLEQSLHDEMIKQNQILLEKQQRISASPRLKTHSVAENNSIANKRVEEKLDKGDEKITKKIRKRKTDEQEEFSAMREVKVVQNTEIERSSSADGNLETSTLAVSEFQVSSKIPSHKSVKSTNRIAQQHIDHHFNSPANEKFGFHAQDFTKIDRDFRNNQS